MCQTDFSRVVENYLRQPSPLGKLCGAGRGMGVGKSMRTRVFSCPATECILVVSKLSPSERGGRMEGRRLAIIDLPLPGAPTIIKLCPPAAATSSALFTFSCPLTSAKSKSQFVCC